MILNSILPGRRWIWALQKHVHEARYCNQSNIIWTGPRAEFLHVNLLNSSISLHVTSTVPLSSHHVVILWCCHAVMLSCCDTTYFWVSTLAAAELPKPICDAAPTNMQPMINWNASSGQVAYWVRPDPNNSTRRQVRDEYNQVVQTWYWLWHIPALRWA